MQKFISFTLQKSGPKIPVRLKQTGECGKQFLSGQTQLDPAYNLMKLGKMPCSSHSRYPPGISCYTGIVMVSSQVKCIPALQNNAIILVCEILLKLRMLM